MMSKEIRLRFEKIEQRLDRLERSRKREKAREGRSISRCNTDFKGVPLGADIKIFTTSMDKVSDYASPS